METLLDPKTTIKTEIDAIFTTSNELFEELPSFWRQTILSKTFSPGHSLELLCKNNQSLLRSVRSCINDHEIHDKPNDSTPWDLPKIEPVVHHYFLNHNQWSSSCPNVQYLQKKLVKQLSFMNELLEQDLSQLQANIKRKPRVITFRALNFYQLLYLLVRQCRMLLDRIQLEQEITLMQMEKRTKELKLRYQI